MSNTDEQAPKDAVLTVDIDKRGLQQRLIWQEIIGARQLCAEANAPAPVLDYYGGTLTLEALPPKGVRLVAIRKY